MSSIVLLARLLLCVVFTVAGVAKLADLKSSRETIVAFGLPESFADPVGTALPVAELLCAVALLATPAVRWGAVGAALLLVTFSGGVAYALSQGRTPDCNCFGQVSSEQISWRTLARNSLLVLVALLVIWKAPGSSLAGWTASGSAASLVAALAVLACALLTVLALRFRALARSAAAAAGAPARPGLIQGSLAPALSLPSLDGETVTLEALRSPGLPVMLVFASPTCHPCHALMPELARWTTALGERLTIALIESGIQDVEPLRAEIEAAGGMLTLLDDDRSAAEAYQVAATPTGVLIDAEGRVASHHAQGGGNIEYLVRQTLSQGDAAVPASAVA